MSIASAQSDVIPKPANQLNVHVSGLRDSKGTVRCTLFFSSQGFPSDDEQFATTISVPIVDRTATCKFSPMAPGVFAVVLFHDEHGDGKFNQNWIGLPLEGYGFSKDPHPHFRAPTFDEASFPCPKGTTDIVVTIHY